MLAVLKTDETFAGNIFIVSERVERTSAAVEDTFQFLAELIANVFVLDTLK